MVMRKVWLGSTGPFLYDDSVLYIDEDGVIAPDNQCAIATDGQIVVQSAPSSPVHTVRKQDLDDAIGDISSLDARITQLEGQMGYLGSTTIPDLYTKIQQNADGIAANYNAIQGLLGRMATAESNITNLLSRTSALEAKFTLNFFDMYLGGWYTSFHGNTYYCISDRFVGLLLPLITDTSAASHIDLGNFPAAINSVLGGGNTAIPILCADTTYGWRWASGNFTSDQFWRMRISPVAGSVGFPVDVVKTLATQTIIWPKN